MPLTHIHTRWHYNVGIKHSRCAVRGKVPWWDGVSYSSYSRVIACFLIPPATQQFDNESKFLLMKQHHNTLTFLHEEILYHKRHIID